MIRRKQGALAEWFVFREALRRLPWIDYVLSCVFIIWGLLSLVAWRAVVTGGRFYSFWWIVHFMGGFTILIGLAQAWAAFRRAYLTRQIAAFFGLFALTSLAWNVDTVTGHLSWGALAFFEFLVCFALVVL